MIEVRYPTLVVEKERVKNNIHRMVKKTRTSGILFSPHFKTHQSRAVGKWFKEAGVVDITVSSVGMARYFAQDPWNSITIAFPFNVHQSEEINKLIPETRQLNLLVSNQESARLLVRNIHQPVGIYFELDAGSGRSGFDSQSTGELIQSIKIVDESDHCKPLGVYSHMGHTYKVRGPEKIREVFSGSFKELTAIINEAWTLDHNPSIAVGDTPSASVLEDFPGVHELHPGNFVFYDLMQYRLGACHEEDIAVYMLCPVVDKNPARKELIIYGGAIHFSKDYLQDEEDNFIFGQMIELTRMNPGKLLHDCYMVGMSQEHGQVRVNDQVLESTQIGDYIGMVPVHSCLTADCMGEYISSEGAVLDHFRIRRRTF